MTQTADEKKRELLLLADRVLRGEKCLTRIYRFLDLCKSQDLLSLLSEVERNLVQRAMDLKHLKITTLSIPSSASGDE